MPEHTADIPANLKDPKDKEKTQFTDALPEYPKLVYNHKLRTTKVARDKDDESKLAKDGFEEEPYPPLDPDQLTPEDAKSLEGLFHRGLELLQKYKLPGNGGKTDAGNAKQPQHQPATTVKK